MKRLALARESGAIGSGMMSAMWGSTAAVPINRCKRIDWLRGRTLFEGLEIDDSYVKKRLGFSAPNIFVLDLSN